MAKRYDTKITKDGGLETNSSENWNIAQTYSQLMVMKLLLKLSSYRKIAQYGYEEMEAKYLLSRNDIAQERRDALYRMASELKELIGNTKFTMKKVDKGTVEDMKERIETVEDFLPDVLASKEDFIKKEIVLSINENHFNTCFKILTNIIDEIRYPLYNAGLIFQMSDDVDIDTMMNQIISGG